MAHSISIKEYCKLRQERGLASSYAGVRQAIVSGRILRGVIKNGGRYLIDPEIADREWAQNSVAHNSNQASFGPAPTASRTESQARKEAALAAMAELDLRQREGELVPIEDVETLWFTLGRQVRDAMESIPARILERILAEVGETGRQQQASIRLILEGEIKQALEQLSKSMTDAARAS